MQKVKTNLSIADANVCAINLMQSFYFSQNSKRYHITGSFLTFFSHDTEKCISAAKDRDAKSQFVLSKLALAHPIHVLAIQ